MTVDSATDLTNNIQSFTARVATAAERLRDVETRIRATSQLLSSIRDLVIARAAKEGINIGRDFKLQDGEQTETGSGNSPNDGGNATGEGEEGASILVNLEGPAEQFQDRPSWRSPVFATW